jgi:lipopolysaccharide export system protein LptA
VKTKIYSLKTGDKVFIDSQKFVFLGNKYETFIYSGKVRGRIKRKRMYEEGLSFNSKKLYFYKGKLKAHLEGKVLLKYKNFEARAQSGDIFLENYNKSLKYFVLNDDVKVKERLILKGRKVVRKAFSERLEGFPGKSQVILTGYPKVFQEEDTIVGNKIILRWNNEVLEIIDANSNMKLKSNKRKK